LRVEDGDRQAWVERFAELVGGCARGAVEREREPLSEFLDGLPPPPPPPLAESGGGEVAFDAKAEREADRAVLDPFGPTADDRRLIEAEQRAATRVVQLADDASNAREWAAAVEATAYIREPSRSAYVLRLQAVLVHLAERRVAARDSFVMASCDHDPFVAWPPPPPPPALETPPADAKRESVPPEPLRLVAPNDAAALAVWRRPSQRAIQRAFATLSPAALLTALELDTAVRIYPCPRCRAFAAPEKVWQSRRADEAQTVRCVCPQCRKVWIA
jgi:hypothetical protein